jgi:hypothetical protein
MESYLNMDKYLRSTEIIDWKHPEVLEIARSLCADTEDLEEKAKRCYHWVRDEIKHSFDYQLSPVTRSASEAVSARTGYCFAKSHLLVALLQTNGIPAGFCYQRLSRDNNGPSFTLHGLVAVCISPYGWSGLILVVIVQTSTHSSHRPLSEWLFILVLPERQTCPKSGRILYRLWLRPFDRTRHGMNYGKTSPT